MKKIVIHVTDKQDLKLRELKQSEGIPITEFIRRLIDKHFRLRR